MTLGAYPFIVPNAQGASVNSAPLSNFQAQYDALDMVIMAAATAGTGVKYDSSGNYGAVAPQASPNMSIRVGPSTDMVLTSEYACAAAASVIIGPNSSGSARFDFIVSDVGGTNYVVAGSAGAIPDFPPLTLDANGNSTQVVKAALYIPNNVTSITSANIISKRMLVTPQSAAQMVQRTLIQ